MIYRVLSVAGLLATLTSIIEYDIYLAENTPTGDLGDVANSLIIGIPAFVSGVIFSGVVAIEGKEKIYSNISKITLAIAYITAVIVLLPSK